MKLRRLMFLSILALAFVALSPAAAPAATGHQVPFKGSWHSVETSTVNFPNGIPTSTVVLEGTGNATHLGRFTVEADLVINLLTGFGTGTEVFTAANGDTVNATGFGQAQLPPAQGFVTIVETLTITGGTGRFANATGSYTLTRLLNISTGVSTGSFDGTISN
jgi:hypothetical protein